MTDDQPTTLLEKIGTVLYGGWILFLFGGSIYLMAFMGVHPKAALFYFLVSIFGSLSLMVALSAIGTAVKNMLKYEHDNPQADIRPQRDGA